MVGNSVFGRLERGKAMMRNDSVTRFSNDTALELADKLNRDSDDWVYVVIPGDGFSLIEVWDKEGCRLGNL